MSEVKIVISGDARGAVAAAGTAAAAVKDIGVSAGISAGQTAAAWRQLPAQFTDIATQLAGGASPGLVLLQQGGQIKDAFGGIRPAAAALLGVLSPVAVVAGAVAAAFGATALAAYQGGQAAKALADALALTGNTAGLTQGRVDAMAVDLAKAGNTTVGATQELLQALAAGGEQTGSTMRSAGLAAIALGKLSGKTAAEAAADFAGMRDNVVAWASAHNKAYAYLSPAMFQHIQALAAQGRTSEAVQLNLSALAETMQARLMPNLGLLDRALQLTSQWWSKMWQAAQGLGKDTTLEERLAAAQAGLERARTGKPGDTFLDADGRRVAGRKSAVASAQDRVDALQSDLRQQAQLADAEAARTDAIKAAQLKASRAYVDAELGVQAAGNADLIARTLSALDVRRVVTERAYRQFEIDGAEYRDKIIAIETERLDAETALAAGALAVERRRVTGNPIEALNKQAAVTQAQAKLDALIGRAALLGGDIGAGKFDPKGREVSDSQQQTFRRLEIGAQGSAGNFPGGEFMREQRNASLAAVAELEASNRALSIELIADTHARGQAQIAEEASTLERRLGLWALNADDRQRVEADFGVWLTLHNAKLEQDLMPAWQKNLQAWRDNNRLLKDSWDTTMASVIKNGEDAWVQLVTTGKLNMSTLVNDIIAQMARVQYRQFVARLSGGSGGGGLLGSLFDAAKTFFGGGGPSLPSTGDFARMDRLSGGRASGGAVSASGLYLVGEQGPELLRMGPQSGAVIPAPASARMLASAGAGRGQGLSINLPTTINIDARSDQAQVSQLVMAGMAQTEKRIWATLRSRGLTPGGV